MAGQSPSGRRWRRRLLQASAAVATSLIVTGIGVWVARKSIATHYVDRMLAEAGVRGRYTIQHLGPFRQRLTGVSIGDPRHPDLIADWVEIDTGLGWTGPSLRGVRAGDVRVAARIVDGGVSLGEIDRLLPRGGGGAAKLPDIAVDVARLRVALGTPAGALAIVGRGVGNLANGFNGRFGIAAPSLVAASCRVAAFRADITVQTRGGRATMAGPAASRQAQCAAAELTKMRGTVNATFSRYFDTVSGQAAVTVDGVRHAQGSATRLTAAADFAGSLLAPRGRISLRADGVAARGMAARTVDVDGGYLFANGAPEFRGRVTAAGASLPGDVRRRIASYAEVATGTPAAGLVRAWVAAADAVGREFAASADITASPRHGSLTGAVLTAPTGARMELRGEGLAIDPSGARIDATVVATGGGLPGVRARLAGDATRGLTGEAEVAAYQAGSSRLAPTHVRLSQGPSGTSFAANPIVSGPLGSGRIERLRVPVSGVIRSDGEIAIGRDCADADFVRAEIDTLRIGQTRLRLCPVDGAWFRQAGGRVSGGVAIAAPRIAGRLGDAPLSIGAGSARLSLGDGTFRLADLAVRLGAPDRQTRFEIVALDGDIRDRLKGRFTSAAGRIGNVPLLLSGANGDWRLEGGRLRLTGALAVADAAETPRYKPMTGERVVLTLDGGRILATGRLIEPAHRIFVSDVTITHDLSTGAGRATLTAPAIDFGKGFQPDDLTPLTFGVIADVNGRLSGEGEIDWTADGVSSTGTFRTAGIDFAAAVSPVSDVSGEIRFTDLLNLESAPGQVIRVGSINPGVAVNDGVVRLQTLSGARVQVEDASWPFAGGQLRLRPTLLDFSRPVERHMIFDVAGVDAGLFLQQFDFKNLNATGTFDGTLPMIFDAGGGRIEGGHLAVRPVGGGTVAYVGEISQRDVGFWGNFAFQALKSLRYRDLDIVMNGPLDGEMITQVNFAGLAQGDGAKRNFLFDRLQKLPLVFNVQIRAPFRQLVDSAQSFYDPRRLVERNLPALLREQNRATSASPPAPAPVASPVQPR